MVDKLKCPFCGAELKNACAQVIYFCPKDECHKAKDWYASKQVWQALIDGKKAQDALNYAIGVLDNLTEIGGVDMEIIKIKKMAGIK